MGSVQGNRDRNRKVTSAFQGSKGTICLKDSEGGGYLVEFVSKCPS